MIGKFWKLVGGGSTLWIYGAVLVFGVSLGGYGVHKLYQASQVGQLKAEISRIESQADERVLLAQEAAERATTRANQEYTAIKKVKAHLPSNPACNLSSDAVRVLNRGRK